MVKTTPRVCIVCGTEFEGLTSGKLCSKACRKLNHKYYCRARHREDPTKYLLGSIQSRCKKGDIPFDLSLGDIVIPEYCPILGIPLFRNIGKPGATKNSPSVDRIDPKKGYTKDNIQVISYKANTMKNDATAEQLLLFADWIYKNFKTT